MAKKQVLNKDILILSILTMITVLIWVVFDVSRVLRKTTVTKVTIKQLAPVNSNFDTKTLEMLKQKLSISEQELNSVPENINLELATLEENSRTATASSENP